MTRFYTLLSMLLLLSVGLSAQLDTITNVRFRFTAAEGDSDFTSTVTIPVVGDRIFSGAALLIRESTDFNLAITLLNGEDDITAQYRDTAENYQVFYEAEGDGISGGITINDTDGQGLPLGFSSSLTTGCTDEDDLEFDGTLRIKLADLTGIKSASSTIDDGTNLFDFTLGVTLQDDADAPPCENEEEIITDVVLAWTPVNGGDTVFARAQDPDGEGPLDLMILDDINLVESTEYTLTMTLTNAIEGEDITEEIREEDDEHMFFFGFTDALFSSPAGEGNFSGRSNPINYNDMDENGLPLGLSTSWTTECGEENTRGNFRVILKHQPDIKSEVSTVSDGGTDVDLTFRININEDPNAPPCENEEEIITDVVLAWIPVDGGDTIFGRANDPDGEGPLDLTIQGDIDLVESTDYTMMIMLTNAIEGEDITEEIREEDDEHMFFFAFDDELFTSPAGDGNFDNREDPINYNDMDENGLPVGLSTNWETECGDEAATGSFRVILKHQPDIKSEVSTVSDGGTDVDLTFRININEDPNAPPCENEEEIITDVVLAWIPVDGGDTIFGRANDPDGEGPLDLTIQGDIDLVESTDYTMMIMLTNAIEGEDITEEIREEDDEHMFFFAFTEGVFSDPMGDGNADNRADSVKYNDFDENGLPVGLSTSWTTASSMDGGTFRVVLKHQPDIKSATSTIDDGGTDVDLTFDLGTTTSNRDVNPTLTSALTLAPNPTRGQLNWRLDQQQIAGSQFEVRIISLATGQVLQSYRSPNAQLDVSQLPVGTYLFQLRTEEGHANKRFIKIN